MCTMCSREIFTKKCHQQQIFDSDLKGAWHYNHATFTPIAKKILIYCRLIYMLSILCVRLAIKVKVGIPESFKVGWYPPKKTGSSHLKTLLSESFGGNCARAPRLTAVWAWVSLLWGTQRSNAKIQRHFRFSPPRTS